MSRKVKTICVDFDGVIHSYLNGWRGPRTIPDIPVPGALDWLDKMMRYYRVAIYSTRSRYWGGRSAIRKWFVRHGGQHLLDQDKFFPFWDGPTNSLWFPRYKPPAQIYIDDRGFQFRGMFPDLEFINSFKPWKIGDSA